MTRLHCCRVQGLLHHFLWGLQVTEWPALQVPDVTVTGLLFILTPCLCLGASISTFSFLATALLLHLNVKSLGLFYYLTGYNSQRCISPVEFSCRGLSGLGMGFVFMVARTITTEWFDTKYSECISLYIRHWTDLGWAWLLESPRQESVWVSLSFHLWQRRWWRNGGLWGLSWSWAGWPALV